jgi:thymidine phosphorylase
MPPLLMAIFFRGMTNDEVFTLTREMRDSGIVLDLSSISARKIDKHSTGGVGDKTSLLLAPIAAACGVVVPMITGRSLGHAGGTLDKLRSIPGFDPHPSQQEIMKALSSVGAVIMGQTKEPRRIGGCIPFETLPLPSSPFRSSQPAFSARSSLKASMGL